MNRKLNAILDTGRPVGTLTEVTGETSILIKNTGKQRLDNYRIYGNCIQETRSGKNLIVPTISNTLNGITRTVNSDGSITIFGTATSSYNVALGRELTIKANTNYVLSNQIIAGNTTNTVWFWNETDSNSNITANINSNKTFLFTSDKNLKGPYIVIPNETTVDFTIKVQLEEGTTPTSYEPFGTMPSPDFPSEILSVGDLQTEGEHVGKYKIEYQSNSINNFKLPESNISNGINYTANSDGTFNLSGTATANAIFKAWVPIDSIENGVNYYLSYSKEINGLDIRVEEYTKENGIWISPFLSKTQKSGIIEKSTGTYIRLAIVVLDGTTINENNLWAQLEKGTTAHSYVPYSNDTITLYLDKPLMAIKSTSANYNLKIGDNYYVADYLDFERQKVVRNYNEIEIEIISTTVWHNEYWANIPKHLDAYSYNNFKAEKIVCECAICNENRVIGTLSSSANNKFYALYIKNGTTLEEIKTKVDGKKMFYQLATPIEEEPIIV